MHLRVKEVQREPSSIVNAVAGEKLTARDLVEVRQDRGPLDCMVVYRIQVIESEYDLGHFVGFVTQDAEQEQPIQVWMGSKLIYEVTHAAG